MCFAVPQIKDLESNLQVACENAISLQKRLEESFAERGLLHAINVNLIHSCQELELKTKEHSSKYSKFMLTLGCQ